MDADVKGSAGLTRQMARQPRHESGRAGAKGPRDRPYKLPCTADPATRRGVTWSHTAALLYAGGEALRVSLGPLSITPGTVIVEVLVGWSPALPYRFPQKRSGVRADFLQVKKKDIIFLIV